MRFRQVFGQPDLESRIGYYLAGSMHGGNPTPLFFHLSFNVFFSIDRHSGIPEPLPRLRRFLTRSVPGTWVTKLVRTRCAPLPGNRPADGSARNKRATDEQELDNGCRSERRALLETA